jgi:hypothetical protein
VSNASFKLHAVLSSFLGTLCFITVVACYAQSGQSPVPSSYYWLQAISQLTTLIFSLHGGFFLSSLIAARQPNIERDTLGKGMSRGLLSLASQLKSYAQEVKAFATTEETAQIRFDAISLQLQNMAIQAEQHMMTLNESFNLKFSVEDITASLKQEIVTRSAREIVYCPDCKQAQEVVLRIAPGSQKQNIHCQNTSCRRCFNVVRSKDGSIITNPSEDFYIVCPECEQEMLVRPRSNESITLQRPCYECFNLHTITVPDKRVIRSEPIDAINISSYDIEKKDKSLKCPHCHETTHFTNKKKNKRGELVNRCRSCNILLRITALSVEQKSTVA